MYPQHPERQTPFYLLAIMLLAVLLLVGCDSTSTAHVTPTQTATLAHTPTALTPILTQPPTLPNRATLVQPGWHILFQRQGNVENGVTSTSTLGHFIASTKFTTYESCIGTGSVEFDLGLGATKSQCMGQNNLNAYTPLPPATQTQYNVTLTITGPALWKVVIEEQN
ncbi:hypothetical protein ccbrp13_48220 [Ktedonobacteria bacterium brp13]|nr:hypothetical protein ccbrp13_48220 [Ktedonobacteria bacterium brp13]